MDTLVGIITLCLVALAASETIIINNTIITTGGGHDFEAMENKFQELQDDGNLDGPIALPCADASHIFEWLTIKGRVTLKNSEISELSAIELEKESSVSTKTSAGLLSEFTLVVNFNIPKLKVTSDYKAVWGGIWKVDGGVENTYKDVSGVMVVSSSHEFACTCSGGIAYEITSAKSVTTKFTGNKLTDNIVNVLMNIFNNSICDRLFGCVKEVLENFMGRLNVIECSR